MRSKGEKCMYLRLCIMKAYKCMAEQRLCEIECKQGTPTINNDAFLPYDCFILKKVILMEK